MSFGRLTRVLLVVYGGNTQKKKDEEGDPIADLTKAFNWAALGIAPDDTASKLQRRLAWGEKSKNV